MSEPPQKRSKEEQRRLSTKNEKARMEKQNEALDLLREHLPIPKDGKKPPGKEITLNLAMRYINHLQEILAGREDVEFDGDVQEILKTTKKNQKVTIERVEEEVARTKSQLGQDQGSSSSQNLAPEVQEKLRVQLEEIWDEKEDENLF